MNPRKRLITIIGIIIILLLGAGLYYFFIRDLIPSSQTADAKIYSNTTYKYQFSYPENYSLTEFSPDSVSISIEEGESFSDSVIINTFVAQMNDSANQSTNFTDFALSQAKTFCDVDGKNISATCPNIATSESFKTKSGLVGKKISFNREVKTLISNEDELSTESSEATQLTYTTDKMETAPVYVFDISDKHPENKFTVLMVSNPLYSDLVTDNDKSFAQSVAQSIKVQ